MYQNKIEYVGDKNYDTTNFLWHMTEICQFKCSYCCAMNSDTMNFDTAIIENVIDKLKQYDGKFTIELQGGEPTLHPKFIYAVKELEKIDNCIEIELVTNLFQPEEYYLDLDSIKKIKITASFHPEYKFDYGNKVIKLNKLLQNFKIYPAINISDRKEFWEDTLNLIDLFKQNNVSYAINILEDVPKYKTSYSDEFKTTFKDIIIETKNHDIPIKFKNYTEQIMHANEMVLLKLDRYRGFKCKCLAYNINVNGEFFNSCSNENVTKLLKKIYLNRYQICRTDHCTYDHKILYHKIQK